MKDPTQKIDPRRKLARLKNKIKKEHSTPATNSPGRSNLSKSHRESGGGIFSTGRTTQRVKMPEFETSTPLPEKVTELEEPQIE